MSTPTQPQAFISYAREDSAFVRKLAADLKANGANVWLDRQDIKPGQSWDTEIERALADSREMFVIIILSPDSVASNNVMNEVAFAMDKGQRVIPVLHRACNVPLLLCRIQRIDMTVDYERGLHALLSTLSGKPHSAQENTKKRINKWFTVGGVVIVIGVACILLAIAFWPQSAQVMPIVQIDSVMLPLSIDIPPGSDATIVTFEEQRTASLHMLHNPDRERLIWPRGIEGIHPPQWRGDSMKKVSIYNRNAYPVSNVKMQFIASFASFADNKAQGWNELAAVKQDIFINTLSPESPFVFYGVNKSKYLVDLRLPKTASLEVQGEVKMRTITVDLRAFSMEQALTRTFPLFPAAYKWKGDDLDIPNGRKRIQATK